MANGRNRTEFIAFYVTAEEKNEIRKRADRHDMSVSDYARKALLGKIDVKPRQE